MTTLSTMLKGYANAMTKTPTLFDLMTMDNLRTSQMFTDDENYLSTIDLLRLLVTLKVIKIGMSNVNYSSLAIRRYVARRLNEQRSQ